MTILDNYKLRKWIFPVKQKISFFYEEKYNVCIEMNIF